MGKVIAFFAILALCGFAFVIGHLLLRRPVAIQQRPMEAGPVLVNRDDGSVYSIGLKIDGFERRLMDEEERTQKLEGALAEVTTEREALKKQVEELANELRRLRKQVNEKPKPLPPPPDASMPPAAGPITSPVVPQPEPLP
jgi:septal ring factor EnvC (AmiA/AmiB activator)